MTWQVLKVQAFPTKHKMKRELDIFLTALTFYTRIPSPISINFEPDYINKASRYFPLIGCLIGSISFGAYWLFNLILPSNIAVVLMLIVGVLVTGAFHEDGLADAADGFGGGWEKSQILTIMKDSRIGTYGSIALVLMFALKIMLLQNLVASTTFRSMELLFLACINYHALARLTAIVLVFTMPYSREDASSKVKPIAKTNTAVEITGAFVFGLLPLGILSWTHPVFLVVLLPLTLLCLGSRRYFFKWIDGYTGDCLGAVEQLAECLCLLTFVY